MVRAARNQVQPFRPLRGGIVITNGDNGPSGTLGFIATSDGVDRFIVSAHHVLRGTGAQLIDDPIFQPALGGSALPVTLTKAARADEGLDIAAALVVPGIAAIGEVLGIGPLGPLLEPAVGMRVLKSGIATGVAEGVVARSTATWCASRCRPATLRSTSSRRSATRDRSGPGDDGEPGRPPRRRQRHRSRGCGRDAIVARPAGVGAGAGVEAGCAVSRAIAPDQRLRECGCGQLWGECPAPAPQPVLESGTPSRHPLLPAPVPPACLRRCASTRVRRARSGCEASPRLKPERSSLLSPPLRKPGGDR